MNSREKGKKGERELAKILRDYGFNARRGVQYHGGADSPDVIGMDGIHIECKRVERLNIDDAMRQSVREAGEETPVVMHRKNAELWLVTMRLNDFIDLYRRANHD